MSQATIAALRRRLYPEIAFGGFSRWDGTMGFYLRVNALVSPESRVLDVGCGTGAHLSAAPVQVRAVQQLKGKVRELIGADVSDECVANPWLDRFVLVSEGRIPLESASIDVCICDWVLEHVRDVERFVDECARLLRPGGYLCIRTPNRWHYSSVAATVLPFRSHARVRKWLGQFHTADDVFPIRYGCNTRRRMRRCLSRHGFASVTYLHRGESHLAGAGRLLGLVGEWVERYSPSPLWHELYAFGQKASAPGSRPAAECQSTIGW